MKRSIGRAPQSGVWVVLGIGGLALVGVGILLAFRVPSDLASVAALVVGAVVAVAAVGGRMPSEVGLQRVTFGPDDRSPDAYRRAWYGAVRQAMPELEPPSRDRDWHPERPTYWVDELQLRIVILWASDRSVHLDVSTVESDVSDVSDTVAVLLVTNVEEIDDLQAAIRSKSGDRAAVVRWRSKADNPSLRATAHGISSPPRPTH